MKRGSPFSLPGVTSHPPWYSPAESLESILGPNSLYHGNYNKLMANLKEEPISVEFYSAQKIVPPLKLRGWYIRGSSNSTTKTGIIFVHGGGNHRGEVLNHVLYFRNAGYNALTYDCSHHGISDGWNNGIGFSTTEALDLVGTIRYCRQELGWEKIGLWGTSVGAASSLVAASLEPVELIFSENAFVSQSDLFKFVYTRFIKHHSVGEIDKRDFGIVIENIAKLTSFIPDFYLDYLVSFTRFYLGFNKSPQPIDAVKNIACPIMFIHSKKDKMIPFSHSLLLYENSVSKNKKLWITEYGVHAEIHNYYGKEYEEKVLDFAKEAFVSKESKSISKS